MNQRLLQFSIFFSIVSFQLLSAQNSKSAKGFKDYFPIAERPFLAAGTGNNPYERILLEAKP
ncbi:MAG: hypothetical protein VYD98_01555, partial [Bacteroidota bacterium]|nr:hypothetical protein [Bacteroidota bacterium]